MSKPPLRPPLRPLGLKLGAALLGAALLVSGLAPLTSAAPAEAAVPSGTLVYIKQNNVWASRADGTGAYQVTRDGTAAAPYENPSMSDAGIIAVEHARKIDVIRTDGSLINRVGMNLFTTSNCSVVVPPGPPLRPRISPDSMKIAYYQLRGVNCGSGIRVESLTGVVHTTTGGLAGSILLGPHPSWVTNSRLVSRDVSLGDVGPGQSANYWFRDSDVINTDPYGFFRDVTEPAVSRNGTRVGFIMANFDRAFILPTQGDPRTGTPAKPTRGTGCVYSSDLTRTDPNTPLVESLSLTSDGSTAILRDGPDIVAVEIPDINDCGSGVITKLVTNAKDPFWSPAAYAVPKPVVLKNTAAPTISGTAKVGRKLVAKRGSWAGNPTSYSYQWYRGSTKIAKATKSTYRLKSADRGKRIRVKITAKRAGFASRTVYSKYTAKVRR